MTNKKRDFCLYSVIYENKFINKINYILWILAGVVVLIVMILAGISAFDKNKIIGSIIYNLLVFLPLFMISILSIIHWYKKKQNGIKTLFNCFILLSIWVISLWLCNYQSNDWNFYLSNWCDSYQNLSLIDALHNITVISNYTPIYNYFLIFITRFLSLQGCLYAVKYLTFLFSIILAVVMELVINEISNTEFNYLHLAIFLLLPPVLLEFTAWGQVDAIYTTFALLAFYFTLKHRSVLCFISLGLSFAIKLQFLFIVPIILVMLIIRDIEGKKYLYWRWVWIVPLMYCINFIPLLVGCSFKNVLFVYISQINYKQSFSNDCLNLPFIFNKLSLLIKNQILINILIVIMSIFALLVTFIFLLLVLRANKRNTLTKTDLVRYALCFSMIMVYLMPKMYQRFYFISAMLGIILLLINNNQLNKISGTLINVSLSFSFLVYFVRSIYQNCNNIIYISSIYLLRIIGFILNTFAIVILIIPIIKDEIKAHKIKINLNSSTDTN